MTDVYFKIPGDSFYNQALSGSLRQNIISQDCNVPFADRYFVTVCSEVWMVSTLALNWFWVTAEKY